MMSYEIVLSELAKRDLEDIDKHTATRIVEKLVSLKNNPFGYVKRLHGVPLYSLRIGDYRVVMDINKKKIVIFVVQIGHRKGIYGNF